MAMQALTLFLTLEDIDMPTFRVYLRHSDGHLEETLITASSFSDSLAAARDRFPSAFATHIYMVDESAVLTVRCPRCNYRFLHTTTWNERESSPAKCSRCQSNIILHRRINIPSSPNGDCNAINMRDAIHSSPSESTEFTRKPSLRDILRILYQNPKHITWHCINCKWRIMCDWEEREEMQTCPVCNCSQRVYPSAYAWNSRIFHQRAEMQRNIDEARQKREDARRLEQEEQDQRIRMAEEAARYEQECMQQEERKRLADLAVEAQLVETEIEFYGLPQDVMDIIKNMSDLADALRADIISALGDNASADEAVAYGRPAAAGASIWSLAHGYGWLGVIFGTVAVGANVFSNDWKRAQQSRYQAKWTDILQGCSKAELRIFTTIFAHKYPSLATIATRMRIPIDT